MGAMASDSGPADPSAVSRLVAEAARACHVKEAVLLRDGGGVVRAAVAPVAQRLVDQRLLQAAGQTYCLQLYDSTDRRLTSVELDNLQDITRRLARQLTGHPAIADDTWTEQSVTEALDHVTDSFLLLRKDWTILHVNARLTSLVGKSRSELVGKDYWQVLPGTIGTPFESELREAMASMSPRQFQLHAEVIDRWFDVRTFPCKEGMAVFTADVTERKADQIARANIEEKLVQVQRVEALGTFAGGIAHDFNNILSVVLGHAGLLADHLQDNPEGVEHLNEIRRAGHRGRDLIQQLLGYCRQANRVLVAQPLPELVQDAVRLIRAVLPPAVELTTDIATEPLATTVNAGEVQQLLMNLCTNAWQALKGGQGRIDIQLRAVNVGEPLPADIGNLSVGQYVKLAVRDDGSGMTPEVRRRVFEPFFTTKPRGQGTGLGLYVLGGIVATHHGAVSLSTGPEGTEFSVFLPRRASAGSHGESHPVESRSRRAAGQRVAYLDDDEVLQTVMNKVLERAGFVVSTFTEPQDLLERLRSHPGEFDLVVTDYHMPSINGLELMKAVRALCPDLPMVLTSGLATEQLANSVRGLGHTDLVPKEQAFEQLADKAMQLLEGSKDPLTDLQ
jgi:signal transduction histidine kinase/ActR/RegA family two-component response regulator